MILFYITPKMQKTRYYGEFLGLTLLLVHILYLCNKKLDPVKHIKYLIVLLLKHTEQSICRSLPIIRPFHLQIYLTLDALFSAIYMQIAILK